MEQQRAQHMEALKWWDRFSPGPMYMIQCLTKSLQEIVNALDRRSHASNLLGSDLLLKVAEIYASPKEERVLADDTKLCKIHNLLKET
jgi:hypothetical protein